MPAKTSVPINSSALDKRDVGGMSMVEMLRQRKAVGAQ
jgi:hypothetical protein